MGAVAGAGGAAGPYRLLITGSRDWSRPGIIRDALEQRQAENPGRAFVLVHGMCDPRHPGTRQAVPWAAALHLRAVRQERLLGADWLADVAARHLGWETEPHPADWRRGKGAGFARNAEMVRLGAHGCDAFLGACVRPGCRDPKPHPSHGSADCAGRAERAGIPVRRHEDG